MKLTINHTVFTAEQVDVPEKCPVCGFSFAESGALVQANTMTGAIVAGRLDAGEFEGGGYTNWDNVVYIPTGYSCGACDETIVEGTTQEESQ